MAANQESTLEVSTVADVPVSNQQEESPSEVNGITENQQETTEITASVESCPVDDTVKAIKSFRFQVMLENGFFTSDLKDDLIRNLNDFLYNLPTDSFLPTFDGYGLRYGKIWFSPENERSCSWLKQTLMDINEKAASDFKFCIQPYCLRQNRLCLNIPWNEKENLSEIDALKRLHYQNPSIRINLWKIVSVKSQSTGNRLIFCSAEHDSVEKLRKCKFRLYYGFQKVTVRVPAQKKSAKSKMGTS